VPNSLAETPLSVWPLEETRNAVATALHAFDHYERSEAARKFVDFAFRSVPKYWEKPELLDDYVKMWNRRQGASK